MEKNYYGRTTVYVKIKSDNGLILFIHILSAIADTTTSIIKKIEISKKYIAFQHSLGIKKTTMTTKLIL
uniref:Uncharacterized protein n=1 Tax=Meloidogyne enterolobii TaxID=390850 RepID=A0A6V7U0R4_MELEN|nr:unnamed protein product [Meloidogyne enterolobii]